MEDVFPPLARGELVSPEATLRRPLETGGRGTLILTLTPTLSLQGRGRKNTGVGWSIRSN